MENLGYLVLLMIVNFLLITFAYRNFGKNGLFIYIAVSVIAANIQVNKFVHYIDIGNFSIDATLGNVMFGGIFLATDLLSEKYGKKTALKSVYYSIFANLAFVAVMVLASLFTAFNADEFTTSFNASFQMLFSANSNMVKAVILGNIVYFISQSLDVRLYSKIMSWLPGNKYLWVRNNGSTIVSQTVDTFLVTFFFALAGIFPFEFFWGVIVSTMFVKLLVALLDTPFLYLMNYIKPKAE